MFSERSVARREVDILQGKQEVIGPRSRSATSSTNHKAQTNNGFALVIVLWWLTLLVFLSTQNIAGSRTEVMIASNIRGSTTAEAEADGAVNEAIFQILSRRWGVDGVTHLIRGAQAVAEVRIDDEGEKIDPNVTPVGTNGGATAGVWRCTKNSRAPCSRNL